MSERIKELYQEHILKKSKDESLKGVVQNETHSLEAYNPMCGDKFTLSLRIKDEVVEDARFDGFGCAISKASTAVLTESIIGKTRDEVAPLVKDFLELIDENGSRNPETIFQDNQLLAFAAAREFPERKTCASLSWDEVYKLVN